MQETSDILIADYERSYLQNDATVKDLIFMGGREVLSLNGEWHYTIDQYNTCLRQKWFRENYYDADGRTLPVDFSFDDWETVTLPCSMNLFKREYFWYEGPFVFTKRFSFDTSALTDRQVLLRIGAVNYVCRVFLNGQYVGQHHGGSTPFMFDVTALLQAENRIILVADNTRNHHYVPTENTDWFNYSGIYRDIELVTVPKEHIKDLRLSLVPGSDFRKIRATVVTSGSTGEAKLTIPELSIEASIPIKDGFGELVIDACPALWSPASPKLYEVQVTYEGDSVSDSVGFREIRVEGRDILLNGEKLFLRGISVHEDSEEHGKALTDEDRLKTIEVAKKLGANYLRLAHYPHHENMAKLCDREGLLLWEEIPVYWAIDFDRPATYADAENQLAEMLFRDYNRASVIIWSVGNENPDSDERYHFMSSLTDYAHAHDDTRMVSAACLVDNVSLSIRDRLAEKLDIIGINEYVGWYSPNFEELPALLYNSNPSKPVIITEFGADATIGYHGSIDEKGTEECQAEVYRRQIETLRTIPYIKGMTPWILFDFRCPRRTAVIQSFYNRKGLVGIDRKTFKPAFAVLRDFYLEMSR